MIRSKPKEEQGTDGRGTKMVCGASSTRRALITHKWRYKERALTTLLEFSRDVWTSEDTSDQIFSGEVDVRPQYKTYTFALTTFSPGDGSNTKLLTSVYKKAFISINENFCPIQD